MLSAQTPSQEWSPRRALLIPSCLLSSLASLSLHWERVIIVFPALLLCNRFQTRRPMAPVLPGQGAAPCTDMLLGTALKNVSLSLRLFPQAQARFSLRQRGCPGIEDFAPCGFITPCSGDQSGNCSIPQAGLSFPKDCCAFPDGMPGQRGFHCMRASPIVLRILFKAGSNSSP